jgi:hypothetical protein
MVKVDLFFAKPCLIENRSGELRIIILGRGANELCELMQVLDTAEGGIQKEKP